MWTQAFLSLSEYDLSEWIRKCNTGCLHQVKTGLHTLGQNHEYLTNKLETPCNQKLPFGNCECVCVSRYGCQSLVWSSMLHSKTPRHFFRWELKKKYWRGNISSGKIRPPLATLLPWVMVKILTSLLSLSYRLHIKAVL